MGHPLSILGWCVTAVGFALLIFWVPTAVEAPLARDFLPRGATVFNAHKAAISQAVIAVGLAMVISGAITSGFEGLSVARRLGGDAEPSAAEGEPFKADEREAGTEATAYAAQGPTRYQMGEPPNFNRLVKTHAVRQGMFSSQEIHEMDNGQFLLHDENGWQPFDSLEEAECHVRGSGNSSP